MKQIQKNILLSVLSGVLGALAFPPMEFTFLAWVCLIPLIFAIRGSSPRQAFWYSYIAGFIFFGSLLYWLVNVTVPGFILLTLMLAVYYALFGMMVRMVLNYSMDLFILPFFWVALEYIRSHMFTGFPWGLLGYSQYTTINLVQIADITGAYGVSFVIVAFNVALFAVLSRRERKIAYMMIALMFILMSTSYGIYRFNNYNVWGSPRISVVQGNIPQEQKWNPGFADEIVKTYTDLTKQAALDEADLIIWPETSYPYLVEAGRPVAEEVNDLAKEEKIPILSGIVYREGDDYYNSAVLFDGSDDKLPIYHKTHLVPFGEYIPFEDSIAFLRGYIDKPIGDFRRGGEYSLFTLKSKASSENVSGQIISRTNFYKFGVLICFEDIFPYLSREFVQNGANFMVNITNDAWFGDTAASRQHLQSSVFRAVENRVPVIRAANTGVSCFVDSTGKIISSVNVEGEETFVTGVLTDRVNIYAGRSFYTVYGDVFVYFCGLMLVLLLMVEGASLRKERKP